jgi:hypothetical protein
MSKTAGTIPHPIVAIKEKFSREAVPGAVRAG